MGDRAGDAAAVVMAVGRSKKQPQGEAKGNRRRSGMGRGFLQAEEVEVKEKINLVRLRYEGAVKDGLDDPHQVLISKIHKAAQLQVSDDRLSVTGFKGFRTARGSHGAHEGAFYCEVLVTRLGKTGHCRVGWCTRKAELQAPVGYDTFGFSFRDVDGSKVTNGLREPYGQGYGEGDVIGMQIYLPKGGRTLEPQQNEYTKYKGKWMRIEDPEPNQEPLPGSVIAFTVNGQFQGVAFRDINEGTYYPAVSLYTMPEQVEGATVTFNFGPNFRYPPPQLEGCTPAMPVSMLPALMDSKAAVTKALAAGASAAADLGVDAAAGDAGEQDMQDVKGLVEVKQEPDVKGAAMALINVAGAGAVEGALAQEGGPMGMELESGAAGEQDELAGAAGPGA